LDHHLAHEDPWKRYWGVWETDQAGSATLAYEQVPTYPVVLIKQRPMPNLSRHAHRIRKVSHDNVVYLKAVFLHESSLFFVYEEMKASLAQLQGSPYVEFNETDIATVSKEVCKDTVWKIENSITYGLRYFKA
jgi:serine/threonine protein kinase